MNYKKNTNFPITIIMIIPYLRFLFCFPRTSELSILMLLKPVTPSNIDSNWKKLIELLTYVFSKRIKIQRNHLVSNYKTPFLLIVICSISHKLFLGKLSNLNLECSHWLTVNETSTLDMRQRKRLFFLYFYIYIGILQF